MTTCWLRSLSTEDLREVERILEADTANYQSLADARRLSVRWQRAYGELKRREGRRYW